MSPSGSLRHRKRNVSSRRVLPWFRMYSETQWDLWYIYSLPPFHPQPKAWLLRPTDGTLPKLKLLPAYNFTNPWKLALSDHLGTTVFRSLISTTYKIQHNTLIQLPNVPHGLLRCSSETKIWFLSYVPLNEVFCHEAFLHFHFAFTFSKKYICIFSSLLLSIK